MEVSHCDKCNQRITGLVVAGRSVPPSRRRIDRGWEVEEHVSDMLVLMLPKLDAAQCNANTPGLAGFPGHMVPRRAGALGPKSTP